MPAAAGVDLPATSHPKTMAITNDDLARMISSIEERMPTLATKDDLEAMEERLTENLGTEQDFTSDSYDNHEQRIRRVETELGLEPIPMKSRK